MNEGVQARQEGTNPWFLAAVAAAAAAAARELEVTERGGRDASSRCLSKAAEADHTRTSASPHVKKRSFGLRAYVRMYTYAYATRYELHFIRQTSQSVFLLFFLTSLVLFLGNCLIDFKLHFQH